MKLAQKEDVENRRNIIAKPRMDNSAVVPVPVQDVQGDGRWMSMHNRFCRQGQCSSCEVLFLGDSLIRNMEETQSWNELFKPMKALNFGIGGDRIEHLLWRMQNGELDKVKPKVVVVLIGTNNHGSTVDQIVEGIEATAWCIQSKLPSAKVLVLALLPRGERPNPLREKHFQVNHMLKPVLSVIPNVHFIDADPGFVKSDSMIDYTDLFDYLHLTRKGYAKFCKIIHEMVVKYMKY